MKTRTVFPNFTLFPKFWENQVRGGHAVFTKPYLLIDSNCMPKIRKIHRAVNEKNRNSWFFTKFSAIFGHFQTRFSGWRSGDTKNLTWGISKVLSFGFLKIQSDFELLFWFPRYKRLKRGPNGKMTYPALDSNPIISRKRFFLDLRFSLKGREGSHLTSHKKSRKSLEPFLRKIEKTSIFATFWHFFQNFWKTRSIFKNRASLLLIIFDCPTPCKKSEKTIDGK